jgi:hypothetical protein
MLTPESSNRRPAEPIRHDRSRLGLSIGSQVVTESAVQAIGGMSPAFAFLTAASDMK